MCIVAYNPLSYNLHLYKIYKWRYLYVAENFGIACRYFREEAEISQEKFAIKIDMDRTYYASVEAGKRNISLQNIMKIANGFEISISELFQKVESL